MTRLSKQDWMQAAMEILIAQGVDGITIEALTQRMGVTKGSFYHHFGDVVTFRKVMLEMCLYQNSTSVIERAEVGETPYRKLMILTDLAAMIDPAEVAIRVWALRDPDAHAMLTETDARRVAYIAQVHRDLGLDEAAAALASRLFYSAFLGGQHLMPPLTSAQMYEMFAALRQMFGITEESSNA